MTKLKPITLFLNKYDDKNDILREFVHTAMIWSYRNIAEAIPYRV